MLVESSTAATTMTQPKGTQTTNRTAARGTSGGAFTATAKQMAVPKARGVFQERDAEESERERGNTEFKSGNFTAAVKAYTKCLGMKAKNYIAFSNRAMAYLKLKEYVRAVVSFIYNREASCLMIVNHLS